MRKINPVRFADRIKSDAAPRPSVFETAEEALEEAEREVASGNVSPTSVMVTFRDGYVTGDGEIHTANGITAAPRPEATPPAVESVLPDDDAPEAESAEDQPLLGIINEELLSNLNLVEPKPEVPDGDEKEDLDEAEVASSWPPDLETKEADEEESSEDE